MYLKRALEELPGLSVHARSTVEADGSGLFLARREDLTRLLGVLGDSTGFSGEFHEASGVLLCPLTSANAAALRARLPWLRPTPLGLRTSAGFGDRLGLATPGHIRAIRRVPGGADRIAPVFAQQSVRENARTGRTPQQVMDDATWGVFQEGWRHPWGADADHLKTPADADDFAAAGFTLFTIDPGDHVVDDLDPAALEGTVRALPWSDLQDTLRDLEHRYLALPFDVETHRVSFDREQLWRAAAKYGRAVAHTVSMFHHISSRMSGRPFELEVSVDETSSPTTVAEHLYIAVELRRLGVRWVSLAPRFVGSFEKGVDYIGDLELFTDEFARHAAVARQLGPYKLSLHSGSDKFTLYPIAARLTRGGGARTPGPLVHVKTAGTSYLEALRTVALLDVELFREVLAFSRDRYEKDRATYHVSAELTRVTAPQDLNDDELPILLEQFDARQLLHVTFGSVLARFGDRLVASLEEHEAMYREVLEAHFERHLSPFVE
jgi:hypothetical protein